jgi:hypothetical protein
MQYNTMLGLRVNFKVKSQVQVNKGGITPSDDDVEGDLTINRMLTRYKLKSVTGPSYFEV